MVDRPACDHGAIPAQDYVQWNAAYAIGGPACTIQQFEQLTGVRIDHYLVVDFAGFQDMVDAVGGVEVCIPEEVNDQEHGIHLEAGTRELEGREALAYVRQRYVLGNRSDLGRIQRQQSFVASMAHKVLSAGTLANPIKLTRFLDAATKSLTVDPGLENVGKIAQLGVQFRGIGLDEVQFITVPWEWDPQNPYNRVVWAEEADDLWQAILEDQPLRDEFTVDAISAADPTTTGGKGNGSKERGDDERAEVNQAAGLCG
jgi:LCP family protein required for cell wall assembly